MALITSHLLNGVDGTHATGVDVTLTVHPSGKLVFKTTTNSKGRVEVELDPKTIDPAAVYELIFNTAGYWAGLDVTGPDLIGEIVLRFVMTDPAGHYHSPVILSPNSYSVWKSSRNAAHQ